MKSLAPPLLIFILTKLKSQLKFQRYWAKDEVKLLEKENKRQVNGSGGTTVLKVDADAPRVFDQIEQEVNQLMNAY